MSYTREQIENTVKAKGYKWFEDASNKTYDVNIVGVRNTSPAVYKKVTNVFDDHLTISFKALCQRNGNVTVWRDANRDLVFEENVTDTGMFGINIHKAGQDSTWVENWSEGCQVFKRVKDFDAFMSICKKAAKIHGNKFSYTLLESTDIK